MRIVTWNVNGIRSLESYFPISFAPPAAAASGTVSGRADDFISNAASPPPAVTIGLSAASSSSQASRASQSSSQSSQAVGPAGAVVGSAPINSLKELFDYFGADIICVQETKIRRNQIDHSLAFIPGYDAFFSSCTIASKKGYAGVATYTRKGTATPVAAEEGFTGQLRARAGSHTKLAAPTAAAAAPAPAPAPAAASDGVAGSIGCYDACLRDFSAAELHSLDAEGRCVVTDHTSFVLFNVYFPNSGGEAQERLDFKLRFYRAFQLRVEALIAAGRHVIVVGDVNCSHRLIDHCDPTQYGPETEFHTMPSRVWFNNFLADLPLTNLSNPSTASAALLVTPTPKATPALATSPAPGASSSVAAAASTADVKQSTPASFDRAETLPIAHATPSTSTDTDPTDDRIVYSEHYDDDADADAAAGAEFQYSDGDDAADGYDGGESAAFSLSPPAVRAAGGGTGDGSAGDSGGKQFVDLFRHYHLNQKAAYTVWNTKTNARQTNYGTRLDYILPNKALGLWHARPLTARSELASQAPAVVVVASGIFTDCHLMTEVMGSDHCPVIAYFNAPNGSLIPGGDGKSEIDPPSLCARYFPELSGKQQNIRSFFTPSAPAPPGMASTSVSPPAAGSSSAVLSGASKLVPLPIDRPSLRTTLGLTAASNGGGGGSKKKPPTPKRKAGSAAGASKSAAAAATKKARSTPTAGAATGSTSIHNFFGAPSAAAASTGSKSSAAAGSSAIGKSISATHPSTAIATSARSTAPPPARISAPAPVSAVPKPAPSTPAPAAAVAASAGGGGAGSTASKQWSSLLTQKETQLMCTGHSYELASLRLRVFTC